MPCDKKTKKKITKVYIGKSYRYHTKSMGGKTYLNKKPPKTAIVISRGKYLTRYAKGPDEYLVPKKGVKLIWSRSKK